MNPWDNPAFWVAAFRTTFGQKKQPEGCGSCFADTGCGCFIAIAIICGIINAICN